MYLKWFVPIIALVALCGAARADVDPRDILRPSTGYTPVQTDVTAIKAILAGGSASKAYIVAPRLVQALRRYARRGYTRAYLTDLSGWTTLIVTRQSGRSSHGWPVELYLKKVGARKTIVSVLPPTER